MFSYLVRSCGIDSLSFSPSPFNIDSAEILKLSDNQLSGTIPSEIGSLINLDQLFLYANGLSGTIPTEIFSLTNLVWLYLFDNQLSGTIPVELGGLSQLRKKLDV